MDLTNESYIINTKDILYNKKAFNNGEINLCFITGFSGSGKSTLAHSKEKDNIEVYELDDVIWNKERFTMENFKEYGDLIYSFFKGIGSKYYMTFNKCEEREEGKWDGDNYERDIILDFIKYSINYANTHKNKKYIIEGVWLYCDDDKGKPFFEPSYFKDYAFYIKGTSAIISAIRAAKRDKTNFTNTLKGIKYRLLDEKNLRKFVEYFRKLSETQNLDEALDYLNKDKLLDKIKEKLSKNKNKSSNKLNITDEQYDKYIEPEVRKLFNAATKVTKEIIKNGNYSKYIDIESYDKEDVEYSFIELKEVDVYIADYYKYLNLYSKEKGYSNKTDAVDDLNNDFIKFGKLVKEKLDLPDGVKFNIFTEGYDWDDFYASLSFSNNYIKSLIKE